MKKKEIDNLLANSAKRMGLTIYLTPANLAEEKNKFFKKFSKGKKYNPRFYYQKPKTDFKGIEKELKKLELEIKPSSAFFLKK